MTLKWHLKKIKWQIFLKLTNFNSFYKVCETSANPADTTLYQARMGIKSILSE